MIKLKVKNSRPVGQVIETESLLRPSDKVIMCKKTECIYNKDYKGIPYCHKERGIIVEKDGSCYNIELPRYSDKEQPQSI